MSDRVKRKLETIVYPKVYEILMKEISYKRRTGRNYHKYLVPSHISGHPNYNLIDCIKFLIMKLKNNRYQVYYVQPNKLVILWNPYGDIAKLRDNLQFLHDEHLRTEEFKHTLNTVSVSQLISNQQPLAIEAPNNKLELPELPSPKKKFPDLKF